MSKMRMLFLTLATAVVSFGVVMNAYSKKHQFYPTVVYLMNSSRSLSVSNCHYIKGRHPVIMF